LKADAPMGLFSLRIPALVLTGKQPKHTKNKNNSILGLQIHSSLSRKKGFEIEFEKT
jgi:hypothetical protein